MDTTRFNELANKYNTLKKQIEDEKSGLLADKCEIEMKIGEIDEKYVDQMLEIENELMHVAYCIRNNLSETHIYFMLKETAENYYKFNYYDHYFSGYYEGMKEAFSLFLPKERIKEIDSNAQAKYPKKSINDILLI